MRINYVTTTSRIQVLSSDPLVEALANRSLSYSDSHHVTKKMKLIMNASKIRSTSGTLKVILRSIHRLRQSYDQIRDFSHMMPGFHEPSKTHVTEFAPRSLTFTYVSLDLIYIKAYSTISLIIGPHTRVSSVTIVLFNILNIKTLYQSSFIAVKILTFSLTYLIHPSSTGENFFQPGF